MNNRLLTSAISALDSVGFDVKLFCYSDSVELDCLGVKFTGIPLLEENCKKEPTVPAKRESNVHFPGETYSISRITGAVDWREALSLAKEDRANEIHVGDFIYVSFEVPEAEHKGVKFPKIKIENAKVVVVARTADKIIFNFEEIIFKSAINANDTNDGGFMDSALSHYLNTEFAEALNISDFLITNHDGMNYSLLTATELFGENKYWDNKTNWNNIRQISYFKNEKNRVKTFEDETAWHWTSSPKAHSASYFCLVGNNGNSSNYNASNVGGIAPAFCVG